MHTVQTYINQTPVVISITIRTKYYEKDNVIFFFILKENVQQTLKTEMENIITAPMKLIIVKMNSHIYLIWLM